LLTSEGYVFRVARNAEDTLKVLEDFVPKIVLMDVQLPDMDGLELTRRLKADPRRPDIIVSPGPPMR
jgi:CheY-like chemotaxis protein